MILGNLAALIERAERRPRLTGRCHSAVTDRRNHPVHHEVVTRDKTMRLTMNNENSTGESPALSILLLGAGALVTVAWAGTLIYFAHAALQHGPS